MYTIVPPSKFEVQNPTIGSPYMSTRLRHRGVIGQVMTSRQCMGRTPLQLSLVQPNIINIQWVVNMHKLTVRSSSSASIILRPDHSYFILRFACNHLCLGFGCLRLQESSRPSMFCGESMHMNSAGRPPAASVGNKALGGLARTTHVANALGVCA